MPEATVLLGGRYRLDRRIERGGVAEVWEGTDEVLARRVAIKVLHAHLASQPGVAERFRHEAIAAARLVHPGIVALYDARVERDDAFLVMELVRGTDLRRLLADRGGRLAPRHAVAIAAQVADALHYAHGAGIVHRDVKPGNVLCDGDRAKVADFGIAKATGLDGDVTQQTAGVLGTAAYLAPEQIEGAPVDARTDVYALGVVLYEMVCGRRPFTADTEAGVALQRLERDPLRPRQVVAGVPRELERVILRAMARRPDDRFASAADLRTALLSIDLDEDAVPLVAADDTPPAGITPSFRQSERSWIVPALAILLLGAALVVVGVVFAGTDVGRDLLHRKSATPPATAARPAPVGGASVSAFDPLGDGAEHDDETANVTDGDPTTTWETSSYRRADFGGLKSGVGLVVRLDHVSTLRRVEVQSPARGWRADVYVADTASSAFPAGWGQPVATLDGTHDLVAADLPSGTRGGAVLLWLTSLPRDGASYRAVVGEVHVLA